MAVDLRQDDGALVCRVDGEALLIQHRWHGETRTARVFPRATTMLQAMLDAGGTHALDAGIYCIHDTLHVRCATQLVCDDGVVDIVQMTTAPIFTVGGSEDARLSSRGVLARGVSGSPRMTNPSIIYDAPVVRPLDEVAHGNNRSAG